MIQVLAITWVVAFVGASALVARASRADRRDQDVSDRLPVPVAGGSTRRGWWPDPTGRAGFRFHDGTSWTASVTADGTPATDRLGCAEGTLDRSCR